MNRFKLLMFAVLVGLMSSCTRYMIVSTDSPVPLYTDDSGANVAFNVPAGSALFLKVSKRNGLRKVRYHSKRRWYWVSFSNVVIIPELNHTFYDSDFYDDSYLDIEGNLSINNTASNNSSNRSSTTTSSGSTGYDATIQTGSRGGKYYINKNGNKTYVKRSTPSGTVKRVGGRGSRGGHH